MLRKLVVIFLFSFLSIVSQSQNIYLNFTDGTTAQFALSNVKNITFSGNDMNLNLNDGSTESWNVLQIERYSYKQFTSVNEFNSAFKDFEVFPNPVQSQLNLSYSTDEVGKMNIELLDVTGKIIYQKEHFNHSSGNHQLSIDVSGEVFSSGIYFCKISTQNSSLTKKIIKQ
ncbi:MAG: T9SS type A sorting domain-containing protein [Chitinophagales bacterium]